MVYGPQTRRMARGLAPPTTTTTTAHLSFTQEDLRLRAAFQLMATNDNPVFRLDRICASFTGTDTAVATARQQARQDFLKSCRDGDVVLAGVEERSGGEFKLLAIHVALLFRAIDRFFFGGIMEGGLLPCSTF